MRDKNESCGYCGAVGLTEREHIVPKSLLLDIEVRHTIPACAECNDLKKKGDEAVRDYIAMAPVTYPTGLAAALRGEDRPERFAPFDGKFLRAVKSKRSDLFKTSKPVDFWRTQQGNVTLSRHSGESVKDGAWWIARGLLNLLVGRRTEHDTPHVISRVSPSWFDGLGRFCRKLTPRDLGYGSRFQVWLGTHESEADTFIMVMAIECRLVFVVTAGKFVDQDFSIFTDDKFELDELRYNLAVTGRPIDVHGDYCLSGDNTVYAMTPVFSWGLPLHIMRKRRAGSSSFYRRKL